MKINLKDIISEVPENKLPNGYSAEAKQQAINLTINDQAITRQNIEGITIDAKESKDLDDGIWAEKMINGGYMIQVSISDVSEAIKPFSFIDYEAIKKTTSIYLSTHNIHMVHPSLSCDKLSLLHQENRLTLTIQIEYDSQMDIVSSDIFESNFYNKNRFDYEDFSNQITNMDSEYFKNLDLFYEIGKKLRAKRIIKGFINFDESDRKIGSNNKKHISSMVIEEFMVSANIEASKYITKNKVIGVYRNHMPEYKGKKLPVKNLERAYYGSTMEYHSGLQEQTYTHFTSPIRRLADLILHRQIKSNLRNDVPVYEEDDIKTLTKHINIQRSILEIIGKNHNFNALLISKHRKLKKRFERIEKREGDIKVYHLKNDIRKLVKTKFKLPEIVRNEIIKQITEGVDETSWSWSLGVFLVSEEKEIISALKRKVLSYPTYRCKKFLSVIGQTIIERKSERVLFVKESERKNKNKVAFKLEIKYIGEIIISEKILVNTDKITLKKGLVRRHVLTEIFNYFLDN